MQSPEHVHALAGGNVGFGSFYAVKDCGDVLNLIAGGTREGHTEGTVSMLVNGVGGVVLLDGLDALHGAFFLSFGGLLFPLPS